MDWNTCYNTTEESIQIFLINVVYHSGRNLLFFKYEILFISCLCTLVTSTKHFFSLKCNCSWKTKKNKKIWKASAGKKCAAEPHCESGQRPSHRWAPHLPLSAMVCLLLRRGWDHWVLQALVKLCRKSLAFLFSTLTDNRWKVFFLLHPSPPLFLPVFHSLWLIPCLKGLLHLYSSLHSSSIICISSPRRQGPNTLRLHPQPHLWSKLWS